MGRPAAGRGIRIYSRMDDLCGNPAGIDRLRDPNREAKELGAGALFPARVESHRCNDSIRDESEISSRLPCVGALVAAVVKSRPTSKEHRCERQVGSSCSGDDRTADLSERRLKRV